MKIRTVFDKTSHNRKLHTGWGVSFLIDGHTLFDTGENGDWLLHNMNVMDIEPAEIKNMILSHDHWDHTGGLWRLIENNPDINVYVCTGFSNKFKNKANSYNANIIENENFSHVSENVYVSGEIKGSYKNSPISEQAVIIKNDSGISIITGCAHPGIVNMISQIKTFFPDEKISLAAGGFHLMASTQTSIKNIIKEFRDLGVKRAGPTHCSGDEAQEMFEKEYKEDFVHIVTGEDFEA